MKLKDADTLFLRIFVLLLVAFLLSSFLAFEAFRATAPPPWRGSAAAHIAARSSGAPSSTPWISIGLDIAIKMLGGAVAAWLAARALSAPMLRLSDASRMLGRSLAPGAGVPVATTPALDEEHGTREVRETARVFNDLARQLRTDFDTQRLLLATVSHDLRTPLTRLRMRLNELEAHPAARKAIDDVRQMDDLIDGLLALFRPAASRTPGAEQRIDAFALAQAIVDDLPGGAPEVTLTGAPVSTPCPPAALRRMLDNLVSNAIRHGGESGPIAISVMPGKDNVEIQVADQGPGLSADQLAHAGTPFLRWSAVEEDDGHQAGLGLGLYITRALAERVGGSLSLASRPGGGLVATLSLPRAS